MIITIIALSLLLFVAIFYCIKFALIILKVKDAVETSFDKLDESYYRISEILQIPLFHDSKEVKSTIKEIENVRNIIHFIASELSSSIEEVDNE